METDKPLAAALRAVENHCDHTEPQAHWIEDMDACSECVQLAAVIARESGLAELVEAVEAWAVLREKAFKMLEGPVSQMDSAESVKIRFDAAAAADRIVAAARRVKEG